MLTIGPGITGHDMIVDLLPMLITGFLYKQILQFVICKKVNYNTAQHLFKKCFSKRKSAVIYFLFIDSCDDSVYQNIQ